EIRSWIVFGLSRSSGVPRYLKDEDESSVGQEDMAHPESCELLSMTSSKLWWLRLDFHIAGGDRRGLKVSVAGGLFSSGVGTSWSRLGWRRPVGGVLTRRPLDNNLQSKTNC
ncbi:unnamed protein product, partial [Nesidiocoris tenuis]